MVVNDTYRTGVTIYRCKWFETLEGPGYRVHGPGHRVGLPSASTDSLVRPRPPPRRRELEVILNYDLVTPEMIARWCSRAFIVRRPLVRILVSNHILESDRRRALVVQFKHPLDAAQFRIDFKDKISLEDW